MNQIAFNEMKYRPEESAISGPIDLQQILARINTLPAMPAIAQKLLGLALNTDHGETQMLKLVAQDSQISAKIIGLSNSALFATPGIITSIIDAAMYLGLTQIKSVAIGMATVSALTKPPEGKLKSADLWAHSMTIASAMRVIAKYMPAKTRPVDEQIFLAGLLHDIGYNVLNFIAKDTCNALYEKLNTPSDASPLEIEHALLGTHHGEIGAQLGIHWGLPAEIIAVIRYHHIPNSTNAEIGQPLVRLVNLAERMLPDFAIIESTAQEITPQEWIALGIDPGKADSIAEEISSVAEQAKQLISII